MTRRGRLISRLLGIATFLFVVGCDAADITAAAFDLTGAILGAVD